MESNSKILSVCLITYNHEKYIRQAIDSVLNQKVDFEFELVIADDCSTDSTRSILLEYKQKYSHFIHLILQEKNVGPARNWLDLLRFPRSKYIAYFEGDDFWTDPHKLQKQIDFLDANPEYNFCIHKVAILEDGRSYDHTFLPPVSREANFYTFENLLHHWEIQTSSFVYRNTETLLSDLMVLINDLPFGDIAIAYLLASQGKVHYIDEVMSCYRIHQTSSTAPQKGNEITGNIRFGEAFLVFIDRFNAMTDFRYDRIIQLYKTRFYFPLADYHHVVGDFDKVEFYLKKIRSKKPSLIFQNKRLYLVLSIKLILSKFKRADAKN
ncbi:MAG: glycosyltransferase [Crocinitomicaceae bacterium]|nr:MAG: glycosyltransferase [Crocinitomicaceae bacterium]